VDVINGEERTMRKVNVFLCAALFMALMGGVILTVSGPTTAEAEQNTANGSHWRHHDGHWNYWHEGDKRWYYTDGSNWFYSNGDAWTVYGFDKQFGREGFEKGDYKTPAAGAKIEAPRHGYYRGPAK
jgi:hypothetical protein